MAHAKVIDGLAPPRGRYPHVKISGDLVFVSGTSSRRPDGSFAGAVPGPHGSATLDIRAQTRAVLENIRTALRAVSLDLADLLQVTTYLVTMADFAGYNEVYGEFFDENGPARTTVAVKELPHPSIAIEIQGVARLATTTEAAR